MKYRLSEHTAIRDEAVYHACHRLQVWVRCKKNNCDKCLYYNSFGVCIKDIAVEIMKNIERKYGIDEELNK
jgi:CO dehydrogenase/acetyl-CoA synthase beta subunit